MKGEIDSDSAQKAGILVFAKEQHFLPASSLGPLEGFTSATPPIIPAPPVPFPNPTARVWSDTI